jgi:hypothetical protein
MLKVGLAAQEKKSRNEKDFSSSLSRASVNAGKTTSSANEKNKDASLPLLHLGTVKPTAPQSLIAEPKSDASVELENSRSLSKEEKATVYAEAKEENPGAAGEEFALAYRIALLKAGVKNGGINLGGNLGEVDLSLFSGTDVEDNSGED